MYHIQAVAVKKFIIGLLAALRGPLQGVCTEQRCCHPPGDRTCSHGQIRAQLGYVDEPAIRFPVHRRSYLAPVQIQRSDWIDSSSLLGIDGNAS